MLSRDFARTELFKLGSLHFPPSTTEAMGVLIDKLAAVSRSEQHCRDIVQAILDAPGSEQRWPTPWTIGDVAHKLLPEPEENARCERCDGLGFTHVIRKGYECAVPCVCRPAAPEPQEQPKERKGKLAKVIPQDWQTQRED